MGDYKSRNRVRLENKANRLAAKGERKSVKGQKKIQKGSIKAGKAMKMIDASNSVGGVMGRIGTNAGMRAHSRAYDIMKRGRKKMARGEKASDRAGKVEKKLIRKAQKGK